MGIVKGLLLIFLFLILIYKYIKLYIYSKKQQEYFIKTLSHDLRVSTLAQIRGLELLEKTKELELVPEINNSCKYTLDMISMLLNTYRFENGEKILDYENFNISECLKTNYNMLQSLANEKGVKFYTKIDFDGFITADKLAITKLLYNLLSTAIFYAEKNSTIVTNAICNNTFYKVSISYCGNSLSDEECRRMFSKNPRFSTVGHGIKMQLCKKIIDFHKGKIRVCNCGANINSFTFMLPITKMKSGAKPQAISMLQLNLF